MEQNNKWLSKRLKIIGKTKMELAQVLDVPFARLTDIENGKWRFQLKHIKKAAEFLNFDQSAFIDFLNNEISEEELYTRKQIKISESDLQLLNAIKNVAANTQNASQNQNTHQQTPTHEKER